MTVANAKPDQIIRGPLGTATVNAASSAWWDVSTVEAKITEAIAYAVSIGAKAVYVPDCFLPYTASQVTFNAAVLMTREGGNPSAIEVRAYGAAGNGVTDDAAAVQAAVNAVPTTGGVVYAAAGLPYMLGSTITVPTDRTVLFRGDGGTATNSAGLASQGSVFKRIATFTSGPLFSQVAPGATTPPYGMRMTGLVLDGNNVAGDLLVCTQMQGLYLEDCTFFNSNGNGVIWTGVFNCFINFCRFFELGNTTAYPNGKSSLVLNSNSNAGTVCVWITQPHFESGRGSYLTCNDSSAGAHPIDDVQIGGGKMEWSGNFTTGFAPPAASAIAMPFIVCQNAINWIVYGLCMFNGFHANATHILIQSSRDCRFYTNHETTSSLADNQLPTFYIDMFSGDYILLSGVFVRGAQAGTSGAHIRVIGTGSNITIDPSNQYDTPASGTPVRIDNPTVNNLGAIKVNQQVQRQKITLTDAATIAVNASLGDFQQVTLAGNRTVGAPSFPVSGQRLTFLVIQDGVGGRTLAWNAVFKTAWVDTGNTLSKRSSISYVYDGTNWSQDGAQSPYI